MVIKTHYDNLKVSRDAPVEVIKSAYRVLSQKYHPDRNPNDSDAVRVMRILNVSYAILSDPERRAEHDRWITEQERNLRDKGHPTQAPRRAPSPECESSEKAECVNGEPDRHPAHPSNSIQNMKRSNDWLWIVISCLLVWIAIETGMLSSQPVSRPEGRRAEGRALLPTEIAEPVELNAPQKVISPQSVIVPTLLPKPGRDNTLLLLEAPHARLDDRSYADNTDCPVRTKTPNGKPWPTKAAYVEGYPRKATGGLSEIMVDNTMNSADVFVKIFLLEKKPFPVRVFFIPKGSQFTVSGMKPGSYDVRYEEQLRCTREKTPPFALEQRTVSDGTEYTKYQITLYQVENGNMRTSRISEDEFE